MIDFIYWFISILGFLIYAGNFTYEYFKDDLDEKENKEDKK